MNNNSNIPLNNQPLTNQPKPDFQPYKRPILLLNNTDIIFAVAAILLSIINVSIGLFGNFHLGFTVSYILTFIIISIYLMQKDTKLRFFPSLCAVLAIASSAVFMIGSNGSVRFWMLIVLYALSAIWFDSLNGYRIEKGELGLIRNIFDSTLGLSFRNIFISLRSLFSGSNKSGKTIIKILIGICCCIPLIAIVLPLLISSDAAFEGMIRQAFGNISEIFIKCILGLLLAPFLISYCYGLKKYIKPVPYDSRFKGIDNLYIISFLTLPTLFYILYLISQLAYFFSAFEGLLPVGYTFTVAEYARRGFFELSVISAINLILVFSALLLSKKDNGKMSLPLKIICSFICIFTLIITATAISKMALYIQNFGMTVLRITTCSFMIFLATVFVALIFKLYIPKTKIIHISLISAAIILLILGFANVNKVVADYNYNLYINADTETIDVYTIYALGDEGIEYLIKLSQDGNKDISYEAKEYLYRCIKHDYYNHIITANQIDTPNSEINYEIETEKIYDGFEYMSLSKIKAYNLLDEYLDDNEMITERLIVELTDYQY